MYPFAVCRFQFQDGSALYGRFRTTETISVMKSVVSSCLTSDDGNDGSSIELYVAPPRRSLDEWKTLAQEGLVPSSKIYVQGGRTIKPELFDAEVVAEGFGVEGVLVKDDGKGEKNDSAKAKGKDSDEGTAKKGPTKEERMLAKMMGKR